MHILNENESLVHKGGSYFRTVYACIHYPASSLNIGLYTSPLSSLYFGVEFQKTKTIVGELQWDGRLQFLASATLVGVEARQVDNLLNSWPLVLNTIR